MLLKSFIVVMQNVSVDLVMKYKHIFSLNEAGTCDMDSFAFQSATVIRMWLVVDRNRWQNCAPALAFLAIT